MDLASIERVCEIVVRGSSDATAFARAQETVMAMGDSVDNITALQNIFDSSINSCAILVAARSLLKLVTDHWNSFTEAQRVDIRNYLLSFLGSKGPQLEEFAVTGVIQLICRIVKFGWFDEGEDMRKIVTEVSKFLQVRTASPASTPAV